LFIRGLQEAGSCPTRADFIRALRNVHNYDGDGLLPAPVDLSTNLGKPSKCLEFVRISDDGRSFVPLRPSLRCGKLLT
jgi:branched-chain amino acid transport system substrate-binding protein